MPDELYDETEVMPGPRAIRADATRPEPRDLAAVIARVKAAMRGTFEATRATTCWNTDLAVLIEAAREIDRLTAERDAARAEVERLRGALEEIADMDGPNGSSPHYGFLGSIAAAALNQDPRHD